MNKLALPIMALVMLFTAGCASNGIITTESYTDEGANTPSVEAKTSNQGDSSDPSATLPDITAYDEPEIIPLDTSINNSEVSNNGSSVEAELPEIPANEEPEIPALDIPANE